MILRTFLILLAMLVWATPVSAQKLYKWIDAKGRVSYHDQPPPPDSGYKVEEKDLGSTRSPQSDATSDAAKKFPVVLYVAKNCSSCDAARVFLRNRGVPFSEKNVQSDRKLQDELIKQAGGLSVPTIMIGTKVMRGYIESLLEGELDEAGYPKPGDQAPEDDSATPSELPPPREPREEDR